MRQVVLIAHNLRSCHNVGSLLRTADGLGVRRVYLTGHTPYPLMAEYDKRLPHLAAKLDRQIRKTALGAERSQAWKHSADIFPLLARLKAQGYTIVALEQSPEAVSLPGYQPTAKLALIVGREVEGVEPVVLAAADMMVEIPMLGQKESFNVVQAAAMALYHIVFVSASENSE